MSPRTLSLIDTIGMCILVPLFIWACAAVLDARLAEMAHPL